MSDSHSGHHGPAYYVKIWGILLVLLAVSICGPELGIQWVTLVTAFGIAIVKAYIVANYFMHLNIERKYIWYLMFTFLLLLAVFFAGVAPDVLMGEGTGWENHKHEMDQSIYGSSHGAEHAGH
jgi:caa(3)-type oxidase subunit IV